MTATLASYVYVYGWGYAALDQPAITAARVHRLARWTEEAPLVLGACVGVAIYVRFLPKISEWVVVVVGLWLWRAPLDSS